MDYIIWERWAVCVCVCCMCCASHIVVPPVNFLPSLQMMQNMFQEGLYQVFFKERSPAGPLAPATNQGELINARIHRWFGTVVGTRLLVTGVRQYFHTLHQTIGFVGRVCFFSLLHIVCVSSQMAQILSAIACILSTVTYACVSYSCSVSMSTPVWPSLCVSPHLPN